jgi:hypothetical protein
MERRRPSIIGPLILITAGILFLMSNMGTLPYSFWEIALRFWPLILILVGLDIIIGRHSIIGGLIVVILWIGLIGGVLWLSFNQAPGLLQGANVVPEDVSQPLGDIKNATINLQIGSARTNVTALNDNSEDLLKGTLRHAPGTRVVKNYTVVGNEARLALAEEGVNFLADGFTLSYWVIALNPVIPIALNVNGGLGSASLDLSALQVTALTIDSSVGSIDVTTPRSGAVTMTLHGGVGSAQIMIPQGVAARIRTHGGLGSINVDQSRFPKFGEAYQSSDYASATSKIDIEVDGGLGSISVR